MPRLLLHVCCGPCGTVAVERLLPRFTVELLWYNPNIEPEAEYELRLAACRQLAAHFGLPLIELPAERDAWQAAVAGYEGEPEGGLRCRQCFRQRLARAAREAGERGCAYLASTLSASPHKDAATLAQVAEQLCPEGLQFLDEDFSQAGGFARSVELSKQLGLYRQRYCGCHYAQRG
ncbi:MAG TPA: epoxyqueuosine reductase QueH [Armatimonadota bacterium]